MANMVGGTEQTAVKVTIDHECWLPPENVINLTTETGSAHLEMNSSSKNVNVPGLLIKFCPFWNLTQLSLFLFPVLRLNCVLGSSMLTRVTTF